MFFCKEMRANRENARADKESFSDEHGFSEKNPHYLVIILTNFE